MSDTPVPPPLPSREPIPVQALPQGFVDDPNRAGSYRQWMQVQPRRPGIITAIGVMSIVVGALGIMAGGLSALYGLVFYFLAQTTSAMSMVPVSAPISVVDSVAETADQPVVTGDRGSDAPQRQIMIDGLATLRPLNDARRQQLDALFAQAGQDVFWGNAGGLGTADVVRAVTESGQTSTADQATPSTGPTADAPDYFVIATGRIEVTDERAVFEPKDRSHESVRVARRLARAVSGATENNQGQAGTNAIPAPTTLPLTTSTWTLSSTASSATAPRSKVSGSVATLVVLEGTLSVLLSVYLLVIGILVLRQHPRGRRLHLIFALLKIPLAIVCGVAWWWYIGEFMAAMATPGTGTSGVNTFRAIVLSVVSGLALLYPIGLLLTLLVPTVRKYYDSDISQ